MKLKRYEGVVQHNFAPHIKRSHRFFTRKGAQKYVDGMRMNLCNLSIGLYNVHETFEFTVRKIA